MSKWLSICEKLSHHTRGIRTWGCPSSSLPTRHSPTTEWAWPQLTQCSGENPNGPVTCCLVLPPSREWPTVDHAADLVDQVHDIHNYACQHLKLTSDKMNTRYNCLANSVGYPEGCIAQPALKESHLSFNPHGGPIQGSPLNQQCSVQDSATT
jgi:hypothetical protein